MADPCSVIDQAIKEIDRLTNLIKKVGSIQIRARGDREIIKANAFSWFKSHRPYLKKLNGDPILEATDKNFRFLLESVERLTTSSVYNRILRNIKSDLVKLRSEATRLFLSTDEEADFFKNQKPNFHKLISDERMINILTHRWDETINCIKVNAPLAATVMMGALLEALFLARVNRLNDKKPLFKLKSTPRDKKTKKPLPLQDWTLNNFIEVSFEMGWIRKPAKDVSIVIRDYRNFIHPVKELSSGFDVEKSDIKMLWSIFVELTNQIIQSS